jgi:hypothetical protein
LLDLNLDWLKIPQLLHVIAKGNAVELSIMYAFLSRMPDLLDRAACGFRGKKI